jgi:acetyltransferase
MIDVGWGDLITHFGDDPHTRSIVCYMESVSDARSFLSAAREVALTKPIIVLKVGHTDAAAKAAASHTGALTGSDAVLDAAFRRVGVLRVKSIEELFDMAEVLAKQPRPRGPRLAIVTNAGGPGALATDSLVASGGKLADLSPGTIAGLDALLPPYWSHGNPIDILGDGSPERYAKAIELATENPDSDGVLVILTPQAMTDATATAEELKPLSKIQGKPILASWMGGPAVDAGEAILNAASVPTFKYPDRAARTFGLMWRYSDNLRGLYETPALPEDSASWTPDRKLVESVIAGARNENRSILTEFESKQLLAAYGIPIARTVIAKTQAEAVAAGEEIGYPIVLKLYSETITHKTDVGGVQLNLGDADAVARAYATIEKSVAEKVGAQHFQGVTVQPMVKLKDAYELIIGSSLDPQFGPVLLFGTGGQLVEVFKDRALGLPPLNSTLARRMMEQTRIYQALQGVRGQPPVDLPQLEQLLVRVSQLVVEHPRIRELDINPLLASAKGLVALDARVVLHPAEIADADLPQPAIRAYPRQYVWNWRTRGGLDLTVRPIRPEDEPRIAEFHATLSDLSVYMRYLHSIPLRQRVAHERLTRICFIDYDREMVLVAEGNGSGSTAPPIVGVGRLSKLHWSEEAEFALLVSDEFQQHGLGTEFLGRLLEVGRAEGLRRIVGYISAENRRMITLATKAGFRAKPQADDPAVIEVTIDL